MAVMGSNNNKSIRNLIKSSGEVFKSSGKIKTTLPRNFDDSLSLRPELIA